MKNRIQLSLIILLITGSLTAQEDPYAVRRNMIFEIIGEDIAVIKNSGRDYVMEKNVNWNYYFLTGDQTEDAVLVLNGKNKSGKIFRTESSNGRRDSVINGLVYRPIEDFKSYLPQIIFRTKTLWMDYSAMVNLEDFGPRLQNLEGTKNIAPMIHDMRKIKDEHEMELLTHAINSTADGLVLKAQKAAIAEMRPGVNIFIASQAARDVLNEGLADLGLITDMESTMQKRFWIQHGFFHHIGLVVHDVGGYQMDLEPGMIITMEPGLYFPADYLEKRMKRRTQSGNKDEMTAFIKQIKPIFEKYINIGVRIEDDVYITENGNKVISAGVPKEIDEIEELMKEISMFNK